MNSLDFEAIRQAAAGRWAEILPALTPLTAEVLSKAAQDHPCPRCDGKSVIWPASDAQQTGRIACRVCTANKPTGDGIATVAAFAAITQGEAAKAVARFVGFDPQNCGPPKRDLIAEVCRDKRMPVDAFLQFAPTIAKRGRDRAEVVRVPVYDATGKVHSYFDFRPGHKGWFARGKGMAGMFFPGRLPQPGETWCVVEGCKDAAALVGLGLLGCGLPTSVMGDQYARLFAGVNVVLVPDLDTAGQTGAQVSGGRLHRIAASVRVARLPGEIVEKGGADVRDVLRRPDGPQLVLDAITTAEQWKPREGEQDDDGRPEVLLTLAYGAICDTVTKHLGQLGWASDWIPERKRERLKLYQRGGLLVHVVREEIDTQAAGGVALPAGSVRIKPLPIGQLPLRVADACQLMSEREKDGEIERIAAPPPRWLIDGIFTRGDYGRDVRRLEAIITAPTLRADGTILQAAGFDDATGLLHIPGDSFPAVPDKPTREEASRAAAELLEVVRDFEFVHEADKSAWLAFVLSMIGRQAIAGCVPLFGITATTRGSGKSLLADSASLIAFGRPAARKPFSGEDDEQRKAITATALEALPAVLLDNVDRVLGGASLDAALTAQTWSDRVLGSSRTTGDLPLRTVWSATGNNLRFGSDLARRVLPIRLAATVENPEERTDFAHADLLGWVRENRPRLAVAALTILRAYFVAGSPQQQGGAWGSFDAWSALIRGSLVWAGLADPLTTRETAKADDTSGAVVRGLVGGLLEIDEHGDGMTVREIVNELNAAGNEERFPTLRETVAEIATSRGAMDHKRLGYALRKYRGRICNGFRLSGTPGHGGVLKWSAERLDDCGGDGAHGLDSFPDPYARSVCVSHSEQSTDETHTFPSGAPGKLSQPSHPSPPSDTGPPCLNCGAATVLGPAVKGWRNADCPRCRTVKPVRVGEVAS